MSAPPPSLSKRKLPIALALALGWTGLALTGGLESVERLTVQARYMMRPAPGFKAPVTIVAIDERSLEQYGQMPWDRRVFARLLDRIKAEHAAVVGIDVAFNEPAHDPAQDKALTIALSHVPTVLPTFLAFAEAGREALRPVEPLAPFAHEAAALGSIQLSSRQQEQMWEVEPYQDALGRWVPAFPIAVVGAYRGAAWTPPPLGPLWRDRPTWINFRGPAHSAPQISAADVLEGRVPAHALDGHMVLVGAVAPGLPDTNFGVPDGRSGPMSGVELSAHVIDNALENGFLHRLSPLALLALMSLLAMGPGRALSRGVGGAMPRSALLALSVAAWSAIAIAAFFGGVWLEVVPVVGFLASCYLAGLVVERTDLLESRNQLLARYASDLSGEAQRQRARIEGELHDGIQQLLIVMGREIRQVQRAVGDGPAASRAEVLASLAEQAQGEIKRLRSDLLPPALRYGGLLDALPVLASEKRARSGLDVKLEVVSWEALPREREIELYWLVSEALNNAEKHAEARTATIRLERTRDEAVLEVIDDGKGFHPPDLSVAPAGVDHSGLHRMWLRMRGNHGDLRITSAPGAGARLRFSLPAEARRMT